MKRFVKISNAFHMIMQIYRGNSRVVSRIAVFLVLLMACNMRLPALSEQIIDDGFIAGNQSIVVRNALLICGIDILIVLLYVAIEKYRLHGYSSIQTNMKRKAVRKLLVIRQDFFNEHSPTEIYHQIDEDINAISGCFSTQILLSVIQIIISIGMLPILMKISAKLTILMLMTIPLKLVKTVLFTPKGYSFSKNFISSKMQYSAWMSDLISGMPTIRQSAIKDYFSQIFEKYQREIVENQYKHEMIQELNIQTESLITKIISATSYILAGYAISGNSLTIGGFVSFETYSLIVLGFIGDFFNVAYAFSALLPSVERFQHFLQEKEESIQGDVIDNSKIDISINQVSFSYEEKKIFEDANLYIPFGKHIGIIGKNGCGKSTLIKLLLRVLPIDSGSITVNGMDATGLSLDSYRCLYSVVPQKPFLFCDTIRNNLCLYKDVSDEDLKHAISVCGLSDLIAEKGLDSCVGQDGSELSGGQRQRISLARTLLHWTPIVILDEAETNIDISYETIIESLMKKEYGDRTVILITHRYDLLKYLDNVYQIEEKKLFENSNS